MISVDAPTLAPLAWTLHRPPTHDPADPTPTGWAPADVEGAPCGELSTQRPSPRRRLRALGTDARPDRSGALLGGRLRLLGRIGRGGMADVYSARDLARGREVAVKLLDPALADDPAVVWRFRQEARLLASIRHPALVRAELAGEDEDGCPFFSMTRVDGETLEARLTAVHRLPPALVLSIGLQLCGVLAALHQLGVIHRDVKPANVLIGRDACSPQVTLIDLGIAKLTHDHFMQPDRCYVTPPTARVYTRQGLILGTPGYAAPEAGEGPVDERYDVFGVGVLVYRALAGRHPFAAQTRLRRGDRPAPVPAIDRLDDDRRAELDEVLAGALAIAPEHRTQSVDALAAELAALASRLPGLRSPQPVPGWRTTLRALGVPR